MIAIAVQTFISMILCFAVGFVTAWIVRGGRERRSFEQFFSDWRGRYDRLERDYDDLLARNGALQRKLAIERENAPAHSPVGTLPPAPNAPLAILETSSFTPAEDGLDKV